MPNFSPSISRWPLPTWRRLLLGKNNKLAESRQCKDTTIDTHQFWFINRFFPRIEVDSRPCRCHTSQAPHVSIKKSHQFKSCSFQSLLGVFLYVGQAHCMISSLQMMLIACWKQSSSCITAMVLSYNSISNF